ncbi:MAG: hypothetical protein CVV28_06985 [Methanobacteriales archaeon HGW-Methanobacteriales-1]|jgi:hypothetical protein|nr:MAG: hypothetical protein CVV28_06985 [Methanobacteriales archaeon HGW-Methanobacteriales-1]
MESLREQMFEYRKQLEKGHIQGAYRGLMSYIMDLRNYLKNKYPEYSVSGIYQGYMDMTYFSFTPDSLKSLKLKIAVVFIYDTFKFEVWLAGSNKNVQKEYWELFTEKSLEKYHIPSSIKGRDSIAENVLVENPDFGDLDSLTQEIEEGTLIFMADVVEFLSND